LDAANAKALDFNQDACFTKCIVQLLLIGVAAETVEKFYDLLSLHVSSFYFIVNRTFS
jgi:hypothetical protein